MSFTHDPIFRSLPTPWSVEPHLRNPLYIKFSQSLLVGILKHKGWCYYCYGKPFEYEILKKIKHEIITIFYSCNPISRLVIRCICLQCWEPYSHPFGDCSYLSCSWIDSAGLKTYDMSSIKSFRLRSNSLESQYKQEARSGEAGSYEGDASHEMITEIIVWTLVILLIIFSI